MCRCPSSRFLRPVLLEGYRFVYDGHSCKWNGAVANIIESENDIVWGGLFEIDQDNLAALDCYEGYPDSYDKDWFMVKDDKGKSCKAITYFRTAKEPGKPSKEYRETVMQGAKDCKLPEEYIRDILAR